MSRTVAGQFLYIKLSYRIVLDYIARMNPARLTRLCGAATKGQILLTPETAERLGGKFRLESIGSVSLKNVGDPVEVWEAKQDRRDTPRG